MVATQLLPSSPVAALLGAGAPTAMARAEDDHRQSSAESAHQFSS